MPLTLDNRKFARIVAIIVNRGFLYTSKLSKAYANPMKWTTFLMNQTLRALYWDIAAQHDRWNINSDLISEDL